MEFKDVLTSRHSIRDYSNRDVSAEVLGRLLEAAALAPSAMNAQPWRYYVTTDGMRDRVGEVIAQATTHLQEFVDVVPRETLDEAVRWYSDLGGAPVVIIVTMVQTEGEFDEINKLLSIGASVENLLLAATNEGLGACNVTFSYFVRDDIAPLLEIDESEQVVSIIALGYPGDSPPHSPAHEMHIGTFLE